MWQAVWLYCGYWVSWRRSCRRGERRQFRRRWRHGRYDSLMASILIIDDNDAVRTALEVLLSLQGHRVLAASLPDEGLRLLAKEQVDLVLQDMNFRKEATSGEERSEERRVGKECRWRWSPSHEKKDEAEEWV